jgi:Ca-activated chloride channel family protein
MKFFARFKSRGQKRSKLFRYGWKISLVVLIGGAGLALLLFYGAWAASFDMKKVGAMPERNTVFDVDGKIYSRLAGAKKAALSFISAQPDNVDIGVVAFQQGGLEAALSTADHATTSAAVRRLKAAGGTSLGDAILASLSAITHKTVAIGRGGSVPNIGFWPSATIVLLSDGQNDGGTAGSTGIDAATNAAAAVAEKAGVHIDTVGVGTTTGTTVVVDGYHLFTALDAAALKSIAQATGGTYHPASDAGELDGIASSINLRLTVTSQPLPLAGAFIALALVLLAAGAVLTVTRTGRVV